MLGDIVNPYYLQVASFILINIILGVSIYITLATGQLSLGHAGFMSIGAYTSAILTLNYNVPIVLGLLAAALLTGLVGVLVGFPALRLQGVYLAIATLGLGEVIRVLFINWEGLTNGAVGIAKIPHMGREILQFSKDIGFDPGVLGLRNNQFSSLSVFIVLLIIAIIVIWFFIRQNNSRVGRAFASIKMDEQASEAMGINITYYKILAFGQGALLAGFAGGLYAHVTAYISPSDFDYHRAVEILIFAIFGGSEVIWGPIFGATFLSAAPEFLRAVSEYRFMIYGALLVLLMAFRPQGIIDVNMVNRFKRKKKNKKKEG
ncbi:ABC-type branched-chain amino acid transport system, permease component [Bacillus sp. OxB-1]|uniref:branched-chain amino acid ABC transporter permease n=1 Tax=Bacillus sp. (strain OxB-1) TaxID=98228 RepID=UPI000581C661|nr:branched-chain amino acid ABC transporter permease [Bacillus sp. OxB-1]BAQ09600.1 ABC-type branched-chain amino acid transport system, permease component [Bacillus sp. OxB-1]